MGGETPTPNGIASWIDKLRAHWVVASVVAVGGFVFVIVLSLGGLAGAINNIDRLFVRYLGSETPAVSAPPASPSPAAGDDESPLPLAELPAPSDEPPPDAGLTFEEYFATYYDLLDRNFERTEFVRKLTGSRVVWRGVVRRVDGGDETLFLYLELPGYGPETDVAQRLFAQVTFDWAWETRLFALHNGDVVTVEGIYRGFGVAPHLEGIDLVLESAAGDPR